MSVNNDKLSFVKINEELDSISKDLATSNPDLKKANVDVSNLFKKANAGKIDHLSRDQILEITSKISQIAVNEALFGGEMLGKVLNQFRKILVKNCAADTRAKSSKANKEAAKPQVKQLRSLLTNLRNAIYYDEIHDEHITEEGIAEIDQKAKDLAEFLKGPNGVNLESDVISFNDELIVLVAQIDKKNFRRAHDADRPNHPEAQIALKLLPAGVLNSARETRLLHEQAQAQKEKIAKVMDGTFDIVDFNEMTPKNNNQKMTQEQLEVALVADFLKVDHPHLKLQHSDLFAEIENRSNLQFDELDAAQLLILGLKEPVKLNNEDNEEDNARIPFMEYLNGILHAARRSDRTKLPDVVLAQHYDVDFNACSEEKISQMRRIINEIVALTKYYRNTAVNAAIRSLQQQFEAQAQPGSKAKSNHIAPALPSAGTRLTADLPDFDEA